MGLIKAFSGSFNSTMADQWKEFIICDSLTSDTLMKKGVKRESKRGSNNDSHDYIISDGSTIVVNEGQAMLLVVNGEVAEFAADPGVYNVKNDQEPSFFETKGLSSKLKNSFNTFAKRFEYGGEAASNSVVYYFNLKEVMGLKFGTAQPIMYDDYVYQSISIRCFGQASIKLVDPIAFFKNISGNVAEGYSANAIWIDILKAEFMMYLSQSLAVLSSKNIKYNQIVQQQVVLGEYMNSAMDTAWIENRGIEVFSVGLESVTLDPADFDKIQKIDEMRLLSNQQNAAGRMTAATANAMEKAADNENGAMMGFAGLNMASGNVANVMQMHGQPNPVPTGVTSDVANWTCSCGTTNQGNFCNECGQKKPVEQLWTCSCGTQNSGKFCSECGQKSPTAAWICSCGTQNTGKFCSECGKVNE